MNKQKTFENSLQELEQLVEKLEQGQLPLDESLELYKQGMLSAKHCQQLLDNAKLTLEKLGEEYALTAPDADNSSEQA